MKVQQQLSMLLSNESSGLRHLLPLLAQAQSTPCLQWDQMPDAVRFKVEDMIDEHPPKKTLCHDNCFRLCAHHPEVHIHTGYVMAPFLIEHSWCSIEYEQKRYFFDPTDLALFHGTHFKDHYQLCSLDRDQALFLAHALEHTGPFHHEVAKQKQSNQIQQLAQKVHLQRQTPSKSSNAEVCLKSSASSTKTL